MLITDKTMMAKSLLITPQTGERKGKSQVKLNTPVCCIDLVRLRRLAILGCLPFNAVYQMTKLVTFDQLILPYLIILLYGSAL